MSRQAPWSVKGVDEEARQIARDAAEAAGLPIGAWIDRTILRATSDAGTTDAPTPRGPGGPEAATPGVPVAPTLRRPDPPAPEPAPIPVEEPAAHALQAPRLGDVTPTRASHMQPATGAPPRDTSMAQQGLSPGPLMEHAPPPRRDATRLLAGSVAALLLLGGGLWLMDRVDAPTPPPPEAIPASLPSTPTGARGEKTAAIPPEQAEPAQTPPADPAAPGAAMPLDRLTEAARAGDAEAQYDLGILYSQGREVPRDDKAAAEWFERAALRGLASAQHNLGVLYEEGRGVPANPQLAFFWYQSAADQGHAGAQHNLGTLYAEGNGTPRNYGKAAELFGKAAAAGVDEGDYSLGLLREHGLGIAKDMAIAREHYRKAAAAGNQKAAARLKQIASLPEQAAPGPAPEATRLTQPTPPSPEAPAPAPVSSAPLGRQGIAEVQQLLRQLNFEPGPSDGIAGGRTIDAIRLYQQFAGLTVDGKPTEALLHDLRQVVGAMKKDNAGSGRR